MRERLQLPWEEDEKLMPRSVKVVYVLLGVVLFVVALVNQCGGGG